MRAAGFLSLQGRARHRERNVDHGPKFKGFNQICVKDIALVRKHDVSVTLPNLLHGCGADTQGLFGPINSGTGFHRLVHFSSKADDTFRAICPTE